MDGWVGGWMDGWMGVKAGLRIAYSNQKALAPKGVRHSPTVGTTLASEATFLKQFGQ